MNECIGANLWRITAHATNKGRVLIEDANGQEITILPPGGRCELFAGFRPFGKVWLQPEKPYENDDVHWEILPIGRG